MAEWKVEDGSECYRDGIHTGKPLDSMANWPEEAPAIQRALSAWLVSHKEYHVTNLKEVGNKHSEKLAESNKQIADLKETIKRQDAALKSKQDELVYAQHQIELHKTKHDELNAKFVTACSHIEALGGTELGKKLARERRLEHIAKTREKLDQEEAKLK